MSGDYNFSLSSEQEQHAQQLHADAISIDMCSMGPGGPALYDRLPEDVVEERLPESMHPIQRFIVGMELPYSLSAEGATDALQTFCQGHTCASFAMGGVTDTELQGLENLNKNVENIPWMSFADTAEDFRRAKAEGTYVTYGFGQPGLAGLPFDLDQFDVARNLGTRSVMLTYNRQDAVGAGCTDRTNAGLSNFGLEVVAKMNDIGLIVDTSHCGKQTTLDACKFSEKPVTANHTSAEAVYKTDRAKSDEELMAVADTGGVVGVYAVPFFLAPQKDRATMDVMLDHIDYIVNLIGWRHVGIGTDWPFMLSHDLVDNTIGGSWEKMGFRAEHEIDNRMHLVGYDDARDFINITRGLVGRGYNDAQIHGILGENFVRVFEEICG